jgi:hypothetical protein
MLEKWKVIVCAHTYNTRELADKRKFAFGNEQASE